MADMRSSEIEKVKLVKEYTMLAPAYDSRWSKYIDASLRMTAEMIGEQSGGRLLDVACGTGRLLDILAQRSDWPILVGADLVPAMLDVARQRTRTGVHLLQSDAAKLPFQSGAFQLVVSTSAMHYFSDHNAALHEMRRVLLPGGHLVITDWCRNYMWMKLLNVVLPWTSHAHVQVLRDRELESCVERAGFKVITSARRKVDWFWGLMTVKAIAN